MKKLPWLLLLLCIITSIPMPAQAQAENAPKILTSIVPLQAIAAAVLKDITAPEVLVPAGQSPHHFSLKPSQMRAINQADILFYISDDFEYFLRKALHQRDLGKLAIALEHAENIILLPVRDTENWQQVEEHNHSANDLHIWLHPENAIAIAEAMVAAVARKYPAYQQQLADNLDAFITEVNSVKAAITAQLQPLQQKPYRVFHDAYQYFEVYFSLSPVGSIVFQPEVPISAARLQEVRHRLKEEKVICIFQEPQFPTRIVNVLREGTAIKKATLDPLGGSLAEDNKSYTDILQKLADEIENCLK